MPEFEYKEDQIDVAGMAKDHWAYVRKTQVQAFKAMCPDMPIEDVEDVEMTLTIEELLEFGRWHYESALIHGFKHGVEWANGERREAEWFEHVINEMGEDD